MSSAKITLLGFYDYLNKSNDDLFKYLILPDGVNKDILVDTILLKSADFESLYGDAYFVQNAIKVWSNKWNRTINKWVEALNIEYNPLENYDRMELWDDVDHSTATAKSTDATTNSSSTTSDDKVSAFNSNQMQNDTLNVTNGNSASNTSSTIDNISDTIHNRVGRAHGNIGVTTSQQMLQSELDIAYWNLYEHIADIFLQEFIIPVY